jgi:Metallo-peptidase family M12/Secretion system C-terminal sorting domain
MQYDYLFQTIGFLVFFKTPKGYFHLSPLADHSVKEVINGNSLDKRIVYSDVEDEFSSTEGMICGNTLNPKNKREAANGREAATANQAPGCKYIKLAIATDTDYSNRQGSIDTGTGTGTDIKEKIYDMVNQMEFVFLDNNFNKSNVAPVGIRIRLTCLSINAMDNTSRGSDGGLMLQYFRNNIGQFFPSSSLYDISHIITGRGLGIAGFGPQFGQAYTPVGSFCVTPAMAASISTIVDFSDNSLISYPNIWKIMLHEISHNLGANDLTNSTPPHLCDPTTKSIMCQGLGKLGYFNEYSRGQLLSHLNDGGSTCLNNLAAPAYTNNFRLKLNGSDIVSSTMTINGATKTLEIPYDQLLPLTSSTFTASNSAVSVTKINNNKAKFNINSVPQFYMNVSATNVCSYSQWSLNFIYSPSGARVAYNAYPNPADASINLDVENIEDIEKMIGLGKILVYADNGRFVKEIILSNSDTANTIITDDLKNGIYYFHLVDKDGNVQKKRIIIKHQ